MYGKINLSLKQLYITQKEKEMLSSSFSFLWLIKELGKRIGFDRKN